MRTLRLELAYLGFWLSKFLEHAISLEFFSVFKIQIQVSIWLKGSCRNCSNNSNGRLSDDVDKNVASYKKSPKAM